MAEKIRSIRTRSKQKEHDDVTKKISNSQINKETLIGDGQRNGKEEEPKHSDRSVEINRTTQLNYNENKTKNYHVQKKQQDIKSENCMKCDKYVATRVQCEYCQRWLHFKYEGTIKEKVYNSRVPGRNAIYL